MGSGGMERKRRWREERVGFLVEDDMVSVRGVRG